MLVLCGVGVAGLAMLLLMSLFSASGTSYEEAIAQQRRATTELLALAESKNKPKKKEKKANKKQAKKEKTKDNASAMTGSELESEAPAENGVDDDSVPAAKGHVEFSPSVVVDVPRDTPPNVKIRKRGKDPKVKPILINKEDPSCVSDPSALSDTTVTSAANHFEEMHPKDDFELLHSTLVAEKVSEKVEEVVDKKDKVVKPVKPAKIVAKSVPPAVEVVKEEVTRERHNSGDGPKEQRKAKKTDKKQPMEEGVEVVREEIVPPLNVPQPSELTTEKLLKQALAAAPPSPVAAPSPPGGKNKKKKAEPNVLSLMASDSSGVNVAELVRVVREAALSRNEIQILTDALLNKHHDPLPEHSEWSEGPNDPMQKMKKQLADKEKALADEVEASQALHAKLKELRTQLNAERVRAGSAVNAARASEQAAAAARADFHALQTRLTRLADDNNQLAQEKIMLQSKLAAEGEAQAQRVQMEMHIQRLSESEQALLGQLGALQAELAAHALEAGQLRLEAGAARDAACLAQQHAADLAQQLADLQQHARAEQHDRLQAMAELQSEVQRLANHAQTSESNAEKIKEEFEKVKDEYEKLKKVSSSSQAESDKIKEEYEKIKQQLSNELGLLREQLSARETELSELKLLKAVPAQNGLPANEQLKVAELAKVESLVESLRDELSAAQRASREQKEHVTRLQEQLAQYQDKNNEALAKSQEAQYNEVASVLRAVCPSAAPTTAADRSWVLTFAENLKRELNKTIAPKTNTAAPKTNTAETEERLKDLQLQNEQSQSLVEKYKRIIMDTEGVLSLLQQNVALEEQKWAQQLADKQQELDELKQRTVMQMQKKIDSLQEELHQGKEAKHNHTLADAERSAEERLMSTLSNKHNIDVSNGPLQMGLEEK